MPKKKELDKDLAQVEGLIPAEDPETFGKIVGAVVKQWGLTKPVDVMMANRMVSAWMKMRYVESKIKEYGIYFEDIDADTGKISKIRVNELAYYLKQLESEFRSYYRLLNSANKTDDEQGTNFMDWIDTN